MQKIYRISRCKPYFSTNPVEVFLKLSLSMPEEQAFPTHVVSSNPAEAEPSFDVIRAEAGLDGFGDFMESALILRLETERCGDVFITDIAVGEGTSTKVFIKEAFCNKIAASLSRVAILS